jgi:ketosteroid isomerase-like protein
MSQQENIELVKELQTRLFKSSPEEVGLLFSTDLDWEIAGDVGALPWIGRKTGRQAIVEFVRDSRDMLERLKFEVHGVLTDADQAVIIGELLSRVKATGKVIDTSFALILTIAGGKITRFQMLEDSFATSAAARASAL